MRLVFKHRYLSIQAMKEVDLPPFAVVIGRNGIGKTQLLDAIAKGNISVVDIPPSDIEKYDIATFRSRDSPKVSWGHCTFAERTAELYLVGSSGTSPVAIAESIFSDALDSPGLSRDPATRARFEDSARQHIRLTPDFARLSAPRDRDICSSYWQRILERVITPLASQSNDSSKNIKNRTCSNDPAVLLRRLAKIT